jgi:hypothetical protein
MGHLIPAGTGLPRYRNLKIDTFGNEFVSDDETDEDVG